jgi:DNA-binding PadR family transcriptional regulator
MLRPEVSFDTGLYFFYFVYMPKGEYLGEFEQFVMLAVLRLAESAYGVPIRQEIEERSGRSTSIGAVYATLDRLGAKGLVQSWLADPTAERGGRAKRFFRLTSAGEAALRESQQAMRRMLEGLRWKWSES